MAHQLHLQVSIDVKRILFPLYENNSSFSSLISGGISIACHDLDVNKKSVVGHIQPFCNKDFENYNSSTGCVTLYKIGDFIKNLDKCQYLYPSIDKHGAFAEHCTKTNRNQFENYMMLKCKNCLSKI